MRLTVALAILLAASGCAGGYGRDFTGLGVVAGVYPVAWAAEEVGGDRADVVNLTPQGTDPHDVELTARDVVLLSRAHVILLLRGFQPALDQAAEETEDVRVVDLLEGAAPMRTTTGERDPHVWLDPVRFARVVRTIGDELTLPARAEELASRLETLDDEFRRGLADCERRRFVTSRDAFGYLAARYRLEGIPLADAEAEAETAGLNPLEGLTKKEIAAGEDYFSVMRSNLRALRKELGCR